MPPVLPTERIAHLGTVDCCIHPSGRNEMIAVTPQIIFSKEAAQNRPPHFLARTSLSTRNRFTPNFQGWCLDENLKPKSSPYGGGAPHRRSAASQNEVGLAARAAPCCASAPMPPSCICDPRRAAGTVGGNLSLRHDTFEVKLAGMCEDGRAVVIPMRRTARLPSTQWRWPICGESIAGQ